MRNKLELHNKNQQNNMEWKKPLLNWPNPKAIADSESCSLDFKYVKFKHYIEYVCYEVCPHFSTGIVCSQCNHLLNVMFNVCRQSCLSSKMVLSSKTDKVTIKSVILCKYWLRRLHVLAHVNRVAVALPEIWSKLRRLWNGHWQGIRRCSDEHLFILHSSLHSEMLLNIF